MSNVTVEVLESGRWAQEPWLPQIDVAKGEKITLSLSFAHKLQAAKRCRILKEKTKDKTPKQIKKKAEKNPAVADKKAAEG
jgi:hypothetical protein